MPDNKLEGQVQLELDDGTTAPVADSSEVSAIQQTSQVAIKFTSGNYDGLINLGQTFSKGILSITNTLIPLVEASLIELLGNASAYSREDFTVDPKIVGMNPIFEISMSYKVSLWIGTDIPKDAVLKDATYVYNKINVMKNVKFEECKIDTATGLLSIKGSLNEV